MEKYFEITEEMKQLDAQVMRQITTQLADIDAIKEENQWKMQAAFTACRVASNHLVGTTGYGYDDAGRNKLEEVFAHLSGSEAALFRHQFQSGTHALAVALFGILRPNDVMLCASGTPYDTLHGVIGIGGKNGQGSLADFGVKYRQLELKDGHPDIEKIAKEAKNAKILYLQRSRGYSNRRTLSLEDIKAASKAAKEINPDIFVVVDNCYGEFVKEKEPTQVGADLIIGSLIKNPGGGIAPTGGYIAGKKELVDLCAQRLSTPGVGSEVGSTSGDILRQMYLGLYFAPGVTAEALKTSIYASALFEKLGCSVFPRYTEKRDDIITAITLNEGEKLAALCRAIQHTSPVDSHLTPEPWPMPGYDCDVIMAAGAFTMGSSIELSCDGPMRPPFTAFLQGGLNFAASRAAVLLAAQAAFGK